METGDSTPAAGTTPRHLGSSHKAGNRAIKPYPSRIEVSDSEEERQKRIKLKRAALVTVDQNGRHIVVVSSDEEDTSGASVVAQKGSQLTQLLDESVLDEQGTNDEDSDSELPPVTPRRRLVSRARTRKVVLSSDSEIEKANEDEVHVPISAVKAVQTPRKRLPVGPEEEIIDLTLSSPESDGPGTGAPGAATVTANDTYKIHAPKLDASNGSEKILPLFLDDTDSDHESPTDPFTFDHGAILTLNEPRSTQKPIRRKNRVGLGLDSPSDPLKSLRTIRASESDSENEVEDIVDSNSVQSVVARVRSTTPRAGPSKSSSKAPRMTKKALQEIELQRRRAYAQTFFNDMNETVFDGGIPAGTKLEWNKRLLTTAGRAHWHKSREGVHTTSIQLAEKILDSDERIRNTLSHEMCHLACWIINNAPDENHGSLFKGWAQKVMRKRPEIEVTTKHSYEIKCKYEWKCANCGKIYGRHSKSINPDEHVCGVCKTGQLVPQFESRRAPKTPKPKADSSNAAARSRDSPLHMPGGFPSPITTKVGGVAAITRTHTLLVISDDDNSDVELMTQTFSNVQL